MNKKQLTLVIILGLVLGGAGLYVLKERQDAFQPQSQRMGDKLLGDYDINSVATVRIQDNSNTVHITKSGETWVVQERNGYPANFGTLKDFLAKLWDMKITKAVRVGPSRLPALELVPPDKSGAGTLLELKDSAGKTTKTLLLGVQHMRESSGNSPFGDSSWPDGRYVMVDGSAENIALVSDPLSQAEPSAQNWVSKDWFKVDKVKSISVVSTNATNNWTLTRESESGTWKLADAQPSESLDTSKSSSVTSAMSYPSFNDVATNDAPESTGLDEPIVATLETFDDFKYTFKVGKPTEDDQNYHLQMQVAASLPKQRTAAEDEKPEDKEKLDQEFNEKVQKLEEKLKTEKAFEEWTYLVSKYTVEPFLKVRTNLLADPKTEAAEDVADVSPEMPAPAVTSPPVMATPAGSAPAEPKPAETNSVPPPPPVPAEAAPGEAGAAPAPAPAEAAPAEAPLEKADEGGAAIQSVPFPEAPEQPKKEPAEPEPVPEPKSEPKPE